MKAITKYIANDGREFVDMAECKSYEENTQAILAKVKERKSNPSEALISMMMKNERMAVERWKKAVEAGSNQSNYRRERGLTETRDDYFVDGVQ